MTPRDRMVVMVLAVVVVLAGAWFGLVGPRRGQASDLGSQVSAARQQRDEAIRQVAAGRAAQRTAATDRATFVALGKAVPSDDDTAALLYELQALAGRSHVALTAMSPSAAPAPAPATTAPLGIAAGAVSSTTTTPTTSTTATTPAPAPAAGATPAPATAGGATPAPATAGGATATAPGAAPAGASPASLSMTPIALTFRGSYRDLERFLRRVDDLITVNGDAVAVRGRLVTVQALNLALDPEGGSALTATITAGTYSAPAPTAPSGGTSLVGAPMNGGAASAAASIPATIGAATP